MVRGKVGLGTMNVLPEVVEEGSKCKVHESGGRVLGVENFAWGTLSSLGDSRKTARIKSQYLKYLHSSGLRTAALTITKTTSFATCQMMHLKTLSKFTPPRDRNCQTESPHKNGSLDCLHHFE